jgi:hypothetical protein
VWLLPILVQRQHQTASDNLKKDSCPFEPLKE